MDRAGHLEPALIARDRLLETLGLTLVVLLAIRGVVIAGTGVLWDLPLAAVPILFMWAPVWLLRARGQDPDRYPLALPAFDDRAAWRAAGSLAGWVVLVVGPLFLVGYHLWQTWLFPMILHALCDAGFRPTCGLARVLSGLELTWTLPPDLLTLIAYHLLFVAIPEEMFYRGYVQSRLDEAWPPRWRILGATLGPGWLVTCVVFALGHSVVSVQWWHVFIVVPSLAFGWMRARSGGIVAGALFHAWCNVTVGVLDHVYGLAP